MARPGIRDFFISIWVTVLLRGIACLAFGLFAFAYPDVALRSLMTVFGIYVVADGMLSIGRTVRRAGNTAPAMLHGMISLSLGLFCLLMPGVAVAYVILFIGLWNIAAGLLQIAGALALRKETGRMIPLLVTGAVSAALGVTIILRPDTSSISAIWLIAATAVFVGIALMIFSLSLRQAATVLLR